MNNEVELYDGYIDTGKVFLCQENAEVVVSDYTKSSEAGKSTIVVSEVKSGQSVSLTGTAASKGSNETISSSIVDTAGISGKANVNRNSDVSSITGGDITMDSFSGNVSSVNVSTFGAGAGTGISLSGVNESAGVKTDNGEVHGKDIVISSSKIDSPKALGITNHQNISDNNKYANFNVTRITSSIYVNAAPDANYYVEVDPQFADYRTWVSSDYFFEQMNSDPEKVGKRVGDGFYEQRAIKEQIINSYGTRLLDGYSSDYEQYKALMDNAVIFATKSGAQVGETLTAEQRQQLDKPIVWYEMQTVQLSDGRNVNALAPVVYLPSGMNADTQELAVISGKNINIVNSETFENTGTVKAQNAISIEAENITNKIGKIEAKKIELQAANDIVNIGGLFQAEEMISLYAGDSVIMQNDIRTILTNIGTETVSKSSAGIVLTGANTSLVIDAKNDIKLQGTNITTHADNGSVLMMAGNDVIITSGKVGMDYLGVDGTKYALNATGSVKSMIDISVSIDIYAVQDIELQGVITNVAGAGANINAGRNVNIFADKNELAFTKEDDYGVVNNNVEHYSDTIFNVSGDIDITAGEKVTMRGVDVSSTGEHNDVNISANDGVNILTAENRDVSSITYYRQDDVRVETSYIGTSVSSEGVINIVSGKDVNIESSAVTGMGKESDVNIYGADNINVTAVSSRESSTIGTSGLLTMNAGKNISLEKVRITSVGEGNDVNSTEADSFPGEGSKLAGVNIISGLDVDVKESNIEATGANSVVNIDAGGNIIAKTHNRQGSVINVNGDIIMTAGQDITLEKANITSTGEGKEVNILAAGDVNILALERKAVYDYEDNWSSYHYLWQEHEGSNIASEGKVNIVSGKDVNIQSSNVIGTGKDSEVSVYAGENINVTATQAIDDRNLDGWYKEIERSVVNEVSTIGANGKVNMGAGKNITLQTANVVASGDNAKINIQAGNDINLTTAKAEKYDYHRIPWGYEINASTTDEGTNLISEGQINLIANKDINAKAAYGDAKELNLTAGKNINIAAGDASSYYEYFYEDTDSGFFSSETTTIHDIVSKETKVGTDLGGDKVTLRAGGDLNVKGSNVIGTGDVNLIATKDTNIDSVTERTGETHIHKVVKSGLFGGGGFGITIGTKSTLDETQQQTATQKGSIIGSVEGDVNIITGENLNVKASDIIAGGNINLTGSNVNVEAGQDNTQYQYRHEEKMSGLSISLGGGVVGTVQENIVKPLERANTATNSKLSALNRIKAASKIKETAQAMGLASTGVDKNGKKTYNDLKKTNIVNLSIGYGSSKSVYTEDGNSSTAVSSGISAGKDVNVTAVEKDINIKGSDVTGENVTLTAKGDINITAAANTNKVESNEEKSSGGFGVSVGTTGTFSVYAKSQKSNTDTDQNISGWTQSNVTAKDTLTLTSGADANIIGSKVKGEKVNANIGGDMNIASLQDTDNYKSKSSSYGFSITSEIGGATNFSVNGNKNKMNSEYASVTDQAGIYAGNRGFDINVANNTDLKGAEIDSTATGDKNTLTTGTITFDDIKNKAEYDSSGYGFSYSGERNKDKKEQNILKQGDKGFIPNIPMGSSDEDSSTTKSAIADGTIVLTKASEQKQDVTQLNRNTQDTLNKLDKIFDKKEIEEKQELAGLFAELSFNAIHDLSATKKDKDGNVIKQGWSEEQKVLAHAAVGYISAELAGSKSSFSTALAAGVNKFVTEEILKDEKALAHYKEHPEELQWLSAALGATIGQMAGDAGSGASIAASATKNNALNDKDALAYIIAKEKGDEETVISLEDKSQRQSEEFQKRYKEDADFAQRYNDAKKANSDLKEFEGYVVWGSSPEKGDGIYTSQEVVEHSHLYFPSDYSVDEKRVFMTPSADKVAGPIIKDAAITLGGLAIQSHPAGAGIVFLYNVYSLNSNQNKLNKGDTSAGNHNVVDSVSLGANAVFPEYKYGIAVSQWILNSTINVVSSSSNNKENTKGKKDK